MDDKSGGRYETCVCCGLDWNVSVSAPQGWYICPVCHYKEKQKKKGGAKRKHGQQSNP